MLLETAFLTAFYGFLRCREFTCNTLSFNPASDLTISDITMDYTFFTLNLKHSKSDQCHKGTPIIISSINSVFCSFSSMFQYLKSLCHATPDNPLFLTADGCPMTRCWFTKKLQLLCQLFTPQSFRIGAATTAAPKVPSATLKEMGRWSSSACERYIRPNAKDIVKRLKAL